MTKGLLAAAAVALTAGCSILNPYDSEFSCPEILAPAAMLLCMLPADDADAADWVNDWFSQSATTSPGGLQTQERGYYTGGSFQGRWRLTNDYPLSVSPPKFQVGCGGIDLFGGGFSYLDPEYLVQKFERIIQAAPAFAFEMAMQEYCKPCSSAMQTMTQITDYLNSIQINDCRLSKQIAAIPFNGDLSSFRDSQAKSMQQHAIGTGQSKNTQGVEDSVRSTGGKSPVDVRDIVSECPAAFKTVFTNGSVVANLASQLGLAADYGDLVRGLIGDVTIDYNSTSKNFVIAPIPACPGNDQLNEADLVTGKLEKRNVAGTCAVTGSQKVTDAVAARLVAITNKMARMGAGGAALDNNERAFLASAPFPLYNLLRDAVSTNNVADTIGVVQDPLASAFAFRMLDDLHKLSTLVLAKTEHVSQTQNVASSNPLRCDTSYLTPAIKKIEAMGELALKYRELAKANYLKQQAELLVNLERAEALLAQRRQGLQTRGASLK